MPSVTSTLKCHRNTYSKNSAMIYFQAETQKALNAGTCKLVPQPTCFKKKKKIWQLHVSSLSFTMSLNSSQRRIRKSGSKRKGLEVYSLKYQGTITAIDKNDTNFSLYLGDLYWVNPGSLQVSSGTGLCTAVKERGGEVRKGRVRWGKGGREETERREQTCGRGALICYGYV